MCACVMGNITAQISQDDNIVKNKSKDDEIEMFLMNEWDKFGE